MNPNAPTLNQQDYVTGQAHFGVVVPTMLFGMALFEAAFK